jgi:hypothetical protein
MEHCATYSQTFTFIPCPPPTTVARQVHEPRQRYELYTETARPFLNAPLDLADLLGCLETDTSLALSLVNRDRLVYLLQVAPWLSPSRAGQDLEATCEWRLQLEQAVVGEFAAVPEVALVYSDRYRAEYMFSIFVRGDRYNDVLMDALLDCELRLVKHLAPQPIMFHYLPYVPGALRREMVSQAARLIFED